MMQRQAAEHALHLGAALGADQRLGLLDHGLLGGALGLLLRLYLPLLGHLAVDHGLAPLLCLLAQRLHGLGRLPLGDVHGRLLILEVGER